jgi:hypothetical protein
MLKKISEIIYINLIGKIFNVQIQTPDTKLYKN